jgi:hypothetical protein
MDAGEMILKIMKGERDADVGKFVWKDGVQPWQKWYSGIDLKA